MGKPIPYDYRVKIVERRKKGESAKFIASTIPYSLSAVNKIWARYQKKGEVAFQTQYSKCGRPKKYGKEYENLVTQIRDNSQGANYVVCKLHQYYPEKETPSARTLQRHWAEQGTSLSKGRPSKKAVEKILDKRSTPYLANRW